MGEGRIVQLARTNLQRGASTTHHKFISGYFRWLFIRRWSNVLKLFLRKTAHSMSMYPNTQQLINLLQYRVSRQLASTEAEEVELSSFGAEPTDVGRV